MTTETRNLIVSMGALALGFITAIAVAFPVSAQETAVGVSLDADTSVSADDDVKTYADVSATTSVSTRPFPNSDEPVTIMRASLGGQAEPAPASASAVATETDLNAYAASAMRADANLDAVTFSGDAVEISYLTPGKLFGFIPVSMKIHARVAADGTVAVSYPWYRFLVASDTTTDVEAALSSRVDAWKKSQASAELTASAKAALMDEIRGALAATVTATAH